MLKEIFYDYNFSIVSFIINTQTERKLPFVSMSPDISYIPDNNFIYLNI